MDKTMHSIVCDACEKELIVDSSYPHHYSLKLSSVDYGYNTSMIEYSIMQQPLLSQDRHFCGFTCLYAWVDSSRAESEPRKQD